MMPIIVSAWTVDASTSDSINSTVSASTEGRSAIVSFSAHTSAYGVPGYCLELYDDDTDGGPKGLRAKVYGTREALAYEAVQWLHGKAVTVDP